MYWDIVKARYVSDYQIDIKFEDGTQGILDLKELIMSSPGIFSELKDISQFVHFEIDSHFKSLQWKNGADISPESAYARVLKR